MIGVHLLCPFGCVSLRSKVVAPFLAKTRISTSSLGGDPGIKLANESPAQTLI